jgi:protein TonB
MKLFACVLSAFALSMALPATAQVSGAAPRRGGPGDSTSLPSWLTSAAPERLTLNRLPKNGIWWLSNKDYPVTAIRAGAEGDVTIAWTITVEGLPADCRVVESSGRTDLDQATCQAILQRGRYIPAQDKYGNPIASSDSATVRWRLPQR